MGKCEVLGRISECGVVPAVRVNYEIQALQAVEALGQGAIPLAEVAMTMP